jgi:hypothetical protein
MTNEQINEAIAEACGWIEIHDSGPWHHHKPWGYPPQPPGAGGNAYKYVPDYCTDLNAMHEAEKVLAPKNWDRFSEKWWNYYHHLLDGDVHKTIHATARQRAEAFLLTLGKWSATDKESLTVGSIS